MANGTWSFADLYFWDAQREIKSLLTSLVLLPNVLSIRVTRKRPRADSASAD